MVAGIAFEKHAQIGRVGESPESDVRKVFGKNARNAYAKDGRRVFRNGNQIAYGVFIVFRDYGVYFAVVLFRFRKPDSFFKTDVHVFGKQLVVGDVLENGIIAYKY